MGDLKECQKYNLMHDILFNRFVDDFSCGRGFEYNVLGEFRHDCGPVSWIRTTSIHALDRFQRGDPEHTIFNHSWSLLSPAFHVLTWHCSQQQSQGNWPQVPVQMSLVRMRAALGENMVASRILCFGSYCDR